MTRDRTAAAEETFRLADLDYQFPSDLIAQHPLPDRDASRLLVVDRENGSCQDRRIGDLPQYLHKGDLLVLNDTKVLPAKFSARRATGGKIGGLFLAEESPGVWRVMLRGSRRVRVDEVLTVSAQSDTGGLRLTLLEKLEAGCWRVAADADELQLAADASAERVLERVGLTPLPPYIRRDERDTSCDAEDRERYQTVYAKSPGAVAAPTAGLHLTDSLLDTLRNGGVETACVTLHVGVGTFKPLEVDDISKHVMHTEWFELPAATADAVRQCRARGGRVVAVGTTSVRVLESAAAPGADRTVEVMSGETDIFIHPPHAFKVVDALLTNFHLPRSTLLALVMAMAGVQITQSAYQHAIDRRYRFYSYGDAMLIV